MELFVRLEQHFMGFGASFLGVLGISFLGYRASSGFFKIGGCGCEVRGAWWLDCAFLAEQQNEWQKQVACSVERR